jgi:hypothetical protein
MSNGPNRGSPLSPKLVLGTVGVIVALLLGTTALNPPDSPTRPPVVDEVTASAPKPARVDAASSVLGSTKKEPFSPQKSLAAKVKMANAEALVKVLKDLRKDLEVRVLL